MSHYENTKIQDRTVQKQERTFGTDEIKAALAKKAGNSHSCDAVAKNSCDAVAKTASF